MTTIASRDLRNHTADVLRQVTGGTRVTVTVNGVPVAEISPVRSSRPQFLSKTDLLEIITHQQADPGLREDLAKLAGETTDDLICRDLAAGAAGHQRASFEPIDHLWAQPIDPTAPGARPRHTI